MLTRMPDQATGTDPTANDAPALTRAQLLARHAAGYADVAVATVTQEYPNYLSHATSGPHDRPLPREIHPAFYGSYDWHSAVEMHWMLVRLLRAAPDRIAQEPVRAVLDAHLAADAIAAEAEYLAGHPGFSRPYGWGWALMLVHEVAGFDDPDARRWAANLAPLGEIVTERFLGWLPKATYPDRYGMHGNSAFGLSRAWAFAQSRAAGGAPGTDSADGRNGGNSKNSADGRLLDALTAAATRWFAADRDYPGAWEPSGSDFLSPALVEAELMTHVLAPERFADWFGRFLPGVAAGEPASLFSPAIVSDSTDGQIAHLHGLNLCRAWAWDRLAAALDTTVEGGGNGSGSGKGDERTALMRAAASTHAEAALGEVSGGDYMVEHWLACYAVLYLS